MARQDFDGVDSCNEEFFQVGKSDRGVSTQADLTQSVDPVNEEFENSGRSGHEKF